MDIKKKFYKAGYLIVTAPVVFYKISLSIIAVVFLIIVIGCNFNSGLQIVDLQAAFTTGNKRTSTEYLIIHHTAGNPNGTVNDLCRVHFGERGWSTVAYPFYIGNDGTVYQLKPDDEVSPHSFHYNNNAIAICCSGNFNDYPMPDAQYEALLKLTRRLLKKFNLTPNDVLRHCDLPGNQTECPGRNFDLTKFRKDL